MLNSQYMWHVALVAWNCVRSVALNALTLSSYYLLYHRSTPVRWKFKSQNTSNNCYPRDCKVYQYRMIMKKKKKKKKKQPARSIYQKKKKKKTMNSEKNCMKHRKTFPLLVIQNITCPPNGTISMKREICL